MNILIRFVVALIAFIAVIKYVAPLLTPIIPPIGTLISVIILIAIVWWFLNGTPIVW